MNVNFNLYLSTRYSERACCCLPKSNSFHILPDQIFQSVATTERRPLAATVWYGIQHTTQRRLSLGTQHRVHRDGALLQRRSSYIDLACVKRKALTVGVVLGRMGSCSRMVRVVLCDSSLAVCDGWRRWLAKSGLDVSVCSDSLATVLGRATGGAVAVVSPGNAFGFLGGGFDLALCRQFGGERFERWFRQRLGGGYHPVGSATVVELDREAFECGEVRYLVHVPTLVTPSRPVFDAGSVVASGYSLVFDAMWNALAQCPAGVGTLVVPGLATGYAGVPSEVACKSMVFALRVFALQVSRELKNTLIMYYLGVGYGAFVGKQCLEECERVGIDWRRLEKFDVTSDDLGDILPSL